MTGGDEERLGLLFGLMMDGLVGLWGRRVSFFLGVFKWFGRVKRNY